MEQLLLLALFLLVAFASSLARWLKTRVEGHPPAETRPPDVTVRRPQRPPGEPAMSVWTPPVTYVRPSPAPPVETQRELARPRFGDRSDLRRAIVLMAVLGPCRALEREEPLPQR